MDPRDIENLRELLIFAAAFVLWGTVGALECNTIGFTQFFIQTIICSAVIWLCVHKILKEKRK